MGRDDEGKKMSQFQIEDRKIGEGHPCYVIAEISCNHNGDLQEAKAIIDAAAEAKADAVKLQTYRADTITRDFKNAPSVGGIWDGMDVYQLYDKAHTPWEWHSTLHEYATSKGLHLFSSPFDETAVDFLIEQKTSVLKVASPEVVDTKLLEKVASTGLPIIMSSGMTTKEELDEAVDVLKKNGTKSLSLLQCNSGYPARFDEANLNTIPAMASEYGCVTGLSDHTLFADPINFEKPMGHVTPFEAVKKGAKIIELHLILDRKKSRTLFEKDEGGYDWAFSREPHELAKLMDMIRLYEAGETVEYASEEEKRVAELTHGIVNYTPTEHEKQNRAYRPSLWVVKDIKAGERFEFCGGRNGNFDSIRPGDGLAVRETDNIVGQIASRDINAGEPLKSDMITKAT